MAVRYATGAPPPPRLAFTRGFLASDQQAKIRRAFVFSLAAACMAAFCLYFIMFASHTVELREREHHLFTANTWFASGIRISPDGPKLYSSPFPTSVYTFLSQPVASNSDRFQLGKAGVVVRPSGYEVWPGWLNKGSVVEIKFAVMYYSLRLFVIRGRDHVESWKQNPKDFDDENHGILMDQSIVGSNIVTFRVKVDGLYFFALGNFMRNPVTSDLFLTVTSAEYDIRYSSRACDLSSNTSPPCVVEMPFGSPRYAVLASKAGGDPNRSERDIRIGYTPRTVSYLLLLASPFVVALLVSLFLSFRESRARSAGALVAAGNTDTQNRTARQQASSAVDQEQSSSRCASEPTVLAVGPTGKAPIPSSWIPSGPAGAAPADETTPLVQPSAPPLEDESNAAGAAAGRLHADDTCSVCMEAPKDSVILDCGHRATCFPCGKLLQGGASPLCPICRQPIRHVAKVYDS